MFAAICAAVAGYLAYRGSPAWRWVALGAGFYLLTGLFAEPVLRPVYLGWMKLARVLGWINTRLLLRLFFYVVLTPVALALRLAGKDLLQRRPDRSARTYWVKREPLSFDAERYERLF
jgi:hypothetical protein